MSKEIRFTVYGEPIAKGRPRMGKWGAYTPEKTVRYEELVKFSYLQTERHRFTDGEALVIRLDIFMSIRTAYIVLTDRAAREGKDVVKKNK